MTTLWYRAPEVLYNYQAWGPTIDTWSMGMVLAELTGMAWHKVGGKDAMMAALPKHLGTPTPDVTSKWLDWRGWGFHARVPWPRAVRTFLGAAGEDLLDKLLAWDPGARVSSQAALEHPFFTPGAMMTPGRAIFAGSRHPWSIVVGSLDVSLLQWLRQDFDPSWATSLQLDFQAARTNVKTEEGRKFIMSGKLTSDIASEGMCGLSVAGLLPAPRLRAFFAAFKVANRAVLETLGERLRTMASGLAPQGMDDNRKHFLQHPVSSWFCNAAEMVISEAGGEWQEPNHQDGAASVMHMGLTLWGHRLLTCDIPEEDPLQVLNAPGTVYMGGLTGPHHQVSHRPCPADALLDGKFSVAYMLRTSLFPHCRSRKRGATPHPPIFFYKMAEIIAETVGHRPWLLPSLNLCLAEFGEPAATTEEPSGGPFGSAAGPPGTSDGPSGSAASGRWAAGRLGMPPRHRLRQKTMAKVTASIRKQPASAKFAAKK